jgi:trk system potassium uptake protein TrkA
VFVLVVGGGKVGYYLSKELVGSGHEVVLMEKDRARADQIADEIGSIVIAHDGCEGKYLGEAGANRADIVAAVTGDDEDNLVICQMAKHHFDVPRTIARVNNPKNEDLFQHLGVDELISPTRMILGAIEQDIPVHELLHLGSLGGSDLELVEAPLLSGSPAIGRAPRDLEIPEGPRRGRQGDRHRTGRVRGGAARAADRPPGGRGGIVGPHRAELRTRDGPRGRRRARRRLHGPTHLQELSEMSRAAWQLAKGPCPGSSVGRRWAHRPDARSS